MALSTLLATFLCTIVLPVLLFLVALRLWEVYMIRGRDPSCPSPLPPGSMGLPFFGETLQLILQVSARRGLMCPQTGGDFQPHVDFKCSHAFWLLPNL